MSKEKPPTDQVSPRLLNDGVPAPSLQDILGDAAPKQARLSGRIWGWLLIGAALVAAGCFGWAYFAQGSSYDYAMARSSSSCCS